MVVFSLMMNAAFSWKEFHSGLRGSASKEAPSFLESSGDLIDLDAKPFDPNTPPATVFGTKKAESLTVMKNARSAFNPSDVVNDASRNFSQRYAKHVLIETAQEYELHAQESGQAPDLLSGDTVAEKKSPVGSGPPKVFRARTYLIGRSLGLPGNYGGGRTEKEGEAAVGSSEASTAPTDGSIASMDTGDVAAADWWSSANLDAQGPPALPDAAAVSAEDGADAPPTAPPIFSGPSSEPAASQPDSTSGV